MENRYKKNSKKKQDYMKRSNSSQKHLEPNSLVLPKRGQAMVIGELGTEVIHEIPMEDRVKMSKGTTSDRDEMQFMVLTEQQI
mmetsp:Transcript_28846/g.43561  ORF Transcript_28846/g.43561 Transcript_28846/m.43561 type:complete len:83 (+) Transcript_28846:545-793(+)